MENSHCITNCLCKYSVLHYWILYGLKTEMLKFSLGQICTDFWIKWNQENSHCITNCLCKYSVLHYWILYGLKTEMLKFSWGQVCTDFWIKWNQESNMEPLRDIHFIIWPFLHFLFEFEAKIHIPKEKLA